MQSEVSQKEKGRYRMTSLPCEIKNMVQKILSTKQKWTHRPQSQTCVTRGQTWGKVIDREFGIYINMLLCIKYITKSDLLYYTWTSTQYSVVVYVGNEPEEEYTHTHTHTHIVSHYCKSETNR